MAAPANSGESDMATEDFCSTLSPLLSPRWSQLCLTPSPPRPFLPSSNSNYSMVMQYQGSNQCMDNPLQNQQWHEEDMVDSAPYLAGDSALLQQQQQLRQNGSEASDWRPSGGGIMKMNNQGFEESNMGFEEESEEMMVMNCISFPPSPTDFPLHRPLPSLSNSTVLPVSDLCNLFEKNLSMVLSNEQDMNNMAQEDMNNMAQDMNKLEQGTQHIYNDASSLLDAITMKESSLHYDKGFAPYMNNIVKDLDRIIGAKGMMSEDNVLLVQNALQQEDMSEMKLTYRMMNLFEHGSKKKNWFEQDDGDNVGQPVLQMVGLMQQLIQNRGGELDFIPGGRCCTINGLEHSDSQDLPMITEPSVVFQTRFAVRVWRGYGGQWMAEIRLRQRMNCLNLGIFTTMEETSAHEMVMRWSGWMDLTGFPESFQKANRSKLPLQLPPLAQEENPDEDFGLVHYNARGNDEIEAVGTGSEGTWDCVMAHQARLNLGKRKTKEKNPEGERRNKKTNGVRIAIPLEDILQTKGMHLKDAANHLEVSIAELESSYRDYGIQRWPPRNEHKLIRQSLPSETLAVVDQEGFPQLSSHTMPSNQALTVTVDINTFSEKEIPSLQFLPTARQENPDAGFGNDEDEAIGMEVTGTGEGVMVEAQFNSGCSGKGKWKEKGLGGERGNNKTTGVRIAIPKEDILRTKGMHLKDAAKHLEAEAVGMGSGGTGQTDIEEGQLNSRYLRKEKRKEMTPGGQKRNKKDAISLEDILRYKEMPQKVAAKHLDVSLSTLKRACRGHGIPIWPPCGEHYQSHPNKSPAVVDKEQIPQLKFDTLLPSNQVSTTTSTKSVTMKARFGKHTIKFQLSWPFGTEELKQQVKKRLELETGTYYINYKDEDNDDILIGCDEDLQDHISRSSIPGTNSIEVFLQPK